MIQTVSHIAHLLPLGSKTRKDCYYSAVFVVGGQCGTLRDGSEAMCVDSALKEVARVYRKCSILGRIPPNPEKGVYPSIRAGRRRPLDMRAIGIGFVGNVEHTGCQGHGNHGNYPRASLDSEFSDHPAQQQNEDYRNEVKGAKRLQALEHIKRR